MLKSDGTKWVDADGKQVLLKGTNLGNWLVQEFWMMGQGGNGVTDQCTLEAKLTERFGYEEKERLIKLFRDSWMSGRDWDQLKAFGFNVVRLPILWSVIEDEKKPKTLRADAWKYIDWSIAEAKKRGIYVILDLHGAAGGQTPNDHTGCAGQNKYWTDADAQERTRWLWQQIATRYKDEPVVAAYDPLNEPWGSTPDAMATRVEELYKVIRAIDPKHIVLLPSHYGSIDAYGNPTDKGFTNVAFELHPYPGLFGDRPGDTPYMVHRDWLLCGQTGAAGVCAYNKQLSDLKIPLLMGEFQPWQGAGVELGGQIGRATYDTFASYGWASTSWSYKVVSPAGGTGNGTWGMVTNAVNANFDTGVGLVAKASTWDCAGWDASFANACAKNVTTIKVGGSGPKTYYFIIKSGALDGSDPDVSFDKISIIDTATSAEVIKNGDFGSNTDWTTLAIDGTLSLNFNDKTAGKSPAGSDGTVLRIARPAGITGAINGGVYQAITLQGGKTYTLSGVFKDNGSTNTWAEMYLLDKPPLPGKDVIDMNGKVDFTTATVAEIETLFKSYATQPYEAHPGLVKWLISPTAPEVFNLPARPAGLKLTEGVGGNVLAWNAVPEAKVIGYNVYRSTTMGGNYVKLADKVVAATFTDTTAAVDATYFYVVTAVAAANESFYSDVASTTIKSVAVPATLQAEAFTAMSGIQTETCSDTGGGLNLGHFDADDYVEYKISIATAGNFTIDYRVASANGSAGFEVWVDGVKAVGAMAVPNTGGWQTWVTQTSVPVALTTGEHTLRLKSVGKEWNLNWLKVSAQ
ncbi:cellulase family glycosylhydrolase [Massilia sp. CF038]|uniref:cellulase family glycosylhydrolase n=1 Tax=Massilia sp. CF038 TaxID=1881045 RepID=UPI000933DF15|nr:cellulase family glycosylhydrolase [Massilia sp. CF038]